MPTQVQPTDTKRKLASLRSHLRHLDTLIRVVEDYDRWISGATSQRVVRDNNWDTVHPKVRSLRTTSTPVMPGM